MTGAVVLSTMVLATQAHMFAGTGGACSVEHSYIVLETLGRMGECLATAERGVQGVAATHLPNELLSVDQALAEATSTFDRVRDLTRDDLGQQHRLDSLSEPLHRRLYYLRERLTALRAGAPARGAEMAELDEVIRRGIGEMVTAERTLLATRKSSRQAASGLARRLTWLGVLSSLGLIAAGMILQTKETRRCQAVEREVATKNQLLDSIIEGTSDTVYVKDLNGRYVHVNSAGARMFGSTPTAMSGKNAFDVMSFDSATVVSQRDQDIIQGGVSRSGEETIMVKGESRTFLTTKEPHRDASQRVIGLIGISRDVTESRRVENERLSDLSLHLNMGELLQACRTLEEAYEAIGQVARMFFPNEPGALYVFDESRHHLESHAKWGNGENAMAAIFAADDCWSLRRGQPHYLTGEGGMPCKHAAREPAEATLCLPLLAYGEMLGVLHLRSVGPMAKPLRKRADVLSEQIATSLANLQLREKLRNQSTRDPLTGLFNRRYTEETLARELHQAGRQCATLSVLAIDVDNFKRFNDTFGHEAGDKVLREIGRVLLESTRGGDVASRMGGEELMILLPGASLADARAKAEQLCFAIRQLEIQHLNGKVGPVTISVGVSAFPLHGRQSDELLRNADAALYRAKHLGRDRVVATDDVVEVLHAPVSQDVTRPFS